MRCDVQVVPLKSALSLKAVHPADGQLKLGFQALSADQIIPAAENNSADPALNFIQHQV
jgi:hypothetical protein